MDISLSQKRHSPLDTVSSSTGQVQALDRQLLEQPDLALTLHLARLIQLMALAAHYRPAGLLLTRLFTAQIR
ncbi:hypothetical protein [Pseudomonas sp. BN102]|uniref:hypothetical protein n=1 Tax=Pseudomonas sp. BN102 TaxID=2567886 RepID=UPI002458D360|nr:hypothetical protein [Pseudomonas sp. BN102]MDH4612521.1 hypothetical protein [Pseudomonas sp. BN102]